MQNQLTKDIFEQFRSNASGSVICSYLGQFNFDVVDRLLKDTKEDLKHPSYQRHLAKRTYNVLVECLENIQKHGANTPNIPDEGMVLVTTHNNEFNILVGNPVLIEEVNTLKERMDEVNLLDKVQLKELYRKIIREGSISDRGGAGLGIVDIAMKSRSHLEYQFIEYNHNNHFFTLQIHIKNN